MNPDFDPGRKMSIPYTWLVLGIGYRKSKVKGVPDSWKWLFDSDAYKNRIALLATIDRILGGRLTVNIISSDMPGEKLASGPRYARTVEAMSILKTLLNGQPLDHPSH